ncbi:hypothetical protein F5Y11DRAFT_364070 [Daldinia sp. FL1419]|nr:hypothetical protein F5Y11DRAFT_364070 [Daldinia sp. FL1419]
MGGADIGDISDGACYFAVNAEAKSDYIPCGNVYSGSDWHCCMAGDICLGDNACFHKNLGITYLAGCTDKQYGAPECPFKGKYSGQQWAGLQRCDGIKDGDRIWAACEETDDLPGLKPPARCACSDDTQVISDKPKLDNIAQLPTGLGGTISWYDGMKPAVTTTAKPSLTKPITTSSLDPSSTLPLNIASGGNPVMPPTDAPTASTNTGTEPTNLSTTAQIGIGVGAGAGALLIGCLAFLVVLLRTRSKKKKARIQSALQDISHPGSPLDSAAPFLSGHHGQADTTYPAFKAELAADEPNSATATAGQPSPLSPSAVSTALSPTAPSFKSQQKQYTAYNPTLHGNYAEKGNAG